MIPFNLGSKPVQQTCLNVALPERIEPALPGRPEESHLQSPTDSVREPLGSYGS